MKLLTKEILNKLPKLYSTDGIPLNEKLVVCKFFTPDSVYSYFAVEYDGVDRFFGYVCGAEKEWGYFSLRELTETRGKLGLPIERDKFFKPAKVKDIEEIYPKEKNGYSMIVRFPTEKGRNN